LILLVLDTDEKSIPLRRKTYSGFKDLIGFGPVAARLSRALCPALSSDVMRATNAAALANSRTAALDQNHKYDNKKYAGNYPDHCWSVHVVLPSLNG
jgi:hypothetical protein